MLEISQLTRCQLRKEEVLRQCAAHRDTLMAEARVLRPMAIWVDVGIAAVRNARACWETWIPFFSSWQAGKGDSGSLIEKITKGFAIARSLKELWKKWF
jgi:hypothetical protein